MIQLNNRMISFWFVRFNCLYALMENLILFSKVRFKIDSTHFALNENNDAVVEVRLLLASSSSHLVF